ncbi:MAG: CCA tRNA nucleotidyltransferase [Pseudomonadota bacterium]
MPPAGAPVRLALQAWMTAPATQAVVAALARGGRPVRFVGGCVRDAILGRPVKDIDLATPDPPAAVMERLAHAGIRVIPTGIEHGTVTAAVGAAHFEITTLRVDRETYGRRARVEFTDDWTADAGRRDFTINAISADPDGTIHDPFGGLADLAAGRVRFVGDAETRVREDVLRLLRFFRFHAYFGRGEPDAAALAACRALAPLTGNLSGERIAGEIFRLLLAPDPAAAIGRMIAAGVLAPVMPEATDTKRLAALQRLPPELAPPDPLLRLAALLARASGAAQKVARRLRLSTAQGAHLVALASPPIEVGPGLDARARRRALHRAGADLFRDLALLAWAERLAGGKLAPQEDAEFRALVAAAAAWVAVELPVKGRDARALGLAPGPDIGRLIGEVERWWEAGDYRAGRAECLAHLRSLVAARKPGPD